MFCIRKALYCSFSGCGRRVLFIFLVLYFSVCVSFYSLARQMLFFLPLSFSFGCCYFSWYQWVLFFFLFGYFYFIANCRFIRFALFSLPFYSFVLLLRFMCFVRIRVLLLLLLFMFTFFALSLSDADFINVRFLCCSSYQLTWKQKQPLERERGRRQERKKNQNLLTQLKNHSNTLRWR